MTNENVKKRVYISIDGKTVDDAIKIFSYLSNRIGKDAKISIDFDNRNIFAEHFSDYTYCENDRMISSDEFNRIKDLNSRNADCEKLKLEFDGL